ncbi:hypothetical protein BGZ63DRAFT_118080 [Mariannaea sp. PMI_226]|nr:hypothetical protein BGZ63DRAFT_118080 [Mariannaea sp. PMI_226]
MELTIPPRKNARLSEPPPLTRSHSFFFFFPWCESKVTIDRCGQVRPQGGSVDNVWQRIQNGLRLWRIGPRRPRDLDECRQICLCHQFSIGEQASCCRALMTLNTQSTFLPPQNSQRYPARSARAMGSTVAVICGTACCFCSCTSQKMEPGVSISIP